MCPAALRCKQNVLPLGHRCIDCRDFLGLDVDTINIHDGHIRLVEMDVCLREGRRADDPNQVRRVRLHLNHDILGLVDE